MKLGTLDGCLPLKLKNVPVCTHFAFRGIYKVSGPCQWVSCNRIGPVGGLLCMVFVPQIAYVLMSDPQTNDYVCQKAVCSYRLLDWSIVFHDLS